jgi:S1-C subfamily serine protease
MDSSSSSSSFNRRRKVWATSGLVAASGLALSVVAWAADSGKPQVTVKVDEQPLARSGVGESASYSPIIKQVAPSVVRVNVTERAKDVEAPELPPFFNDPQFRQFFGTPYGYGGGEGGRGGRSGRQMQRQPEQRSAVPGMAALYRKIAERNPAPGATPIFFVSSSPRQLTDNLRRFLQLNGFPRGVLQLKEISTERGDSLLDSATYKRKHIETIFAAFPGVKFLLIGDDGEGDPEIFAEVAAKHPERVEGIWIRRVNADTTRTKPPGQRDLAELLSDGSEK